MMVTHNTEWHVMSAARVHSNLPKLSLVIGSVWLS